MRFSSVCFLLLIARHAWAHLETVEFGAGPQQVQTHNFLGAAISSLKTANAGLYPDLLLQAPVQAFSSALSREPHTKHNQKGKKPGHHPGEGSPPNAEPPRPRQDDSEPKDLVNWDGVEIQPRRNGGGQHGQSRAHGMLSGWLTGFPGLPGHRENSHNSGSDKRPHPGDSPSSSPGSNGSSGEIPSSPPPDNQSKAGGQSSAEDEADRRALQEGPINSGAKTEEETAAAAPPPSEIPGSPGTRSPPHESGLAHRPSHRDGGHLRGGPH